MEQMLLILVIALLVWVGTGIGRGSAPIDQQAMPGRSETPPAAKPAPPRDPH